MKYYRIYWKSPKHEDPQRSLLLYTEEQAEEKIRLWTAQGIGIKTTCMPVEEIPEHPDEIYDETLTRSERLIRVQHVEQLQKEGKL